MSGQGWRHFPHARLRDFHDGDTCEVEVDSGFGAYQRVAVRVYGISAPEVSGAEKAHGLDALRLARELAWTGEAIDGAPCELWTWKQSFARYVGRIEIRGQRKFDLAQALLGLGGARAWDGKTERPRFDAFPVAHPDAEVAEYQRLLARDFRP